MADSTAPPQPKGTFVRKESAFRNWIEARPDAPFPAEAGRYHLYVSYACPFANRTLIGRRLKGLEKVISVDVVSWVLHKGTTGWDFNKETGSTGDSLYDSTYLSELYKMADPDFDGKVSVPVLWDKQKKTIVNNESSEILRMFNTAFNTLCATDEQRDLDLYPTDLQRNIDDINKWVNSDLNNGVYRAGFAESQEAYQIACRDVFGALEKVERILSLSLYLVGDQLTEADVRLVTTLLRFDIAYHGLFKCNLKRLRDYPNIQRYIKDLYLHPSIGSTIHWKHIKRSYYMSMKTLNPLGIVPLGPEVIIEGVETNDNE